MHALHIFRARSGDLETALELVEAFIRRIGTDDNWCSPVCAASFESRERRVVAPKKDPRDLRRVGQDVLEHWKNERTVERDAAAFRLADIVNHLFYFCPPPSRAVWKQFETRHFEGGLGNEGKLVDTILRRYGSAPALRDEVRSAKRAATSSARLTAKGGFPFFKPSKTAKLGQHRLFDLGGRGVVYYLAFDVHF